MTTSSSAPTSTIAATVVAEALGLPSPTPEQQRVIEAPLAPALVIAGAGSGKTETMAGRVVWLVANGLVRPDEVLGLTFTRKAAGELAERINARLKRIGEFRRRGLIPHLTALSANGDLERLWNLVRAEPAHTQPAVLSRLLDSIAESLELSPAAPAAFLLEDALLRPRVSTYNAFADALVRDHSARIGRDAEASVLGDAGSWLLARRVVTASVDERLATREDRFGTIVDAVKRLSGEFLDNRADPDDVGGFGDRLAAHVAPLTNPQLASPGDIEGLHRALSALPILSGLVKDYAQLKEALGALDFADQVAGALQIIESAPEVAAQLREQHRVVLLDEYQDTSVLQTRMLAAIFHDGGVMAVGDPHQSIYGWRGASADNLAAFASTFAPESSCGHYSLMVSWRNDTRILEAANALIAGVDPGVPVSALAARPGAHEGSVERIFVPTLHDEAQATADWFGRRRSAHAGKSPHTGAILFRAKRHMSVFADALAAAGIPHRILGLGGLLATPEVVDVVAVLRVLQDPAEGSSLIRLLTGARFSIGVADMARLHELAVMLSQRDSTGLRLPPEVIARVRASVGPDEQVSIIDALDVLRRLPENHQLLAGFSDVARIRLIEAGAMFEKLRRLTGLPIPELIRAIELELRLDIELAANETRGSARLAAAQLRTFVDEVRTFLAADDRGSISSLLAWLDHAEETDELMPRTEPPEPGVVQLLTIHGSKGLEWDAVAVVRMVKDELPKRPRSSMGWMGFGVLPYPFRGDRDALPVLDVEGASDDRKTLAAHIKVFKQSMAEHQEAEELRLAYVAVTRARSSLLLTGSAWGGQKDQRAASSYLESIGNALELEPLPAIEQIDNPYGEESGATLQWPMDPLGARRAIVERAAAEVEAAREAALNDNTSQSISEELQRLLRERDFRENPPHVEAPGRVAASHFKEFVKNYSATVTSLSRPLPERPYRQAQQGTLFHAWVEARSGLVGDAVNSDDGLWERDTQGDGDTETAHDDEQQKYREVFLRSQWADLQPLEVETEIEITLTGARGLGRVVCKLDAVYQRGNRIEIVDWKTGRPPASPREEQERLLQLALYRLAYHKRHGTPLEQIDVALFYVGADVVIRPDRVLTEGQLVDAWNHARDARDGESRTE